jgi:2-polyprenyl-3-methyl-5-hydroxy-6-metoxy-1,4-benzoquinol methylase
MTINPHFDDNRVVWNDSYAGLYEPVAYGEQFDGQWKSFLEQERGFVQHTGVETSDEYIDDRICELTGVPAWLHRRKYGALSPLLRLLSGYDARAKQRGMGGRLYLDPKFDILHFEGKRCLDIGCGAGRWTRTLMSLGASVKSVDMSEHGLKSTARFNPDVEKLDLFDIAARRSDLQQAFDFTLCWGVVMCTHDPLLAFENVASTVRPGGELYIMVYAPTYHASEFVLEARRKYHRQLATAESRRQYLLELAKDDPDNAINYLDMLNTAYNWTIDEETIQGWSVKFGFVDVHFLNADEPHKCAHHVLMRKG